MTNHRNDIKRSIVIDVPVKKAWHALIDPVTIKEYLFGTEAVSDWKVGSSITFRGIWEGKRYEDKGEILQMIPEKILQYTHPRSSGTGGESGSGGYHIVTFELAEQGKDATLVTIIQDNNPDEADMKRFEKNWEGVLSSMKQVLESKR